MRESLLTPKAILAMVSMVNIPYTSFISNDDLRTNKEALQYRIVLLLSHMFYLNF